MKRVIRDGLVLRSVDTHSASDRENLGKFYVEVFGDAGDEDAPVFMPWTEDLLGGKHPTMTPDDAWVVIDPAQSDKIVSALLLIPQTWRYEDIEIPVGRPEIIATDPDYRNRGLVRELMSVAHERSAALGHVMQGITGIGHYYRRFGYTMAVDLGSGAELPMFGVPRQKDGEQPAFTLRPATNLDIPQIIALEAYDHHDCCVTVKRDAAIWDFEFNHRSQETPHHMQCHIIVGEQGQDVGFVTIHMDQYYPRVSIRHFVVGDQSSYLATYDDVLRGIKSIAEMYYRDASDEQRPVKILFDSCVSPGVKQLVRATDGGIVRDTAYAWYIRVDDIVRFTKHVAPVLERRLVGSGANCYSGELKIGFYNLNGLRMVFEDGHITDVVSEAMLQYEDDAAMPYDSFLNLVFGHRTWEEMRYVLPEIYAKRKAQLLLAALFPKMRSSVYGLA